MPYSRSANEQFVILCSNRRLQIRPFAALEKSAFPRCRMCPAFHNLNATFVSGNHSHAAGLTLSVSRAQLSLMSRMLVWGVSSAPYIGRPCCTRAHFRERCPTFVMPRSPPAFISWSYKLSAYYDEIKNDPERNEKLGSQSREQD